MFVCTPTAEKDVKALVSGIWIRRVGRMLTLLPSPPTEIWMCPTCSPGKSPLIRLIPGRGNFN